MKTTKNELRLIVRRIIRESISKKKVNEMMSFPGDSDYEENVVTFTRGSGAEGKCGVCKDETPAEELARNKGLCDYCSSSPREEDNVPQTDIHKW